MKKKVLFSAVVLLAASATFAQGNGMAGVKETNHMGKNYFDPATKINLTHRAGGGFVGGGER